MSLAIRSDVRVTIAGISCATVFDVEVSQNAYREAGTFRISLVLGSEAESSRLSQVLSPNGTGGQPELGVTIQIGQSSSSNGSMAWLSLMVGTVDRVSMDVESRIVEIEGRDLLSRLIDSPSSGNFVNQTSSEIVSSLATTAGLAANVTRTSIIIGQYYEIEHSRTSLDAHARFATAFDIVAYLADAEGFDVWMSNEALNFGVASEQSASMRVDVSTLEAGTGTPTLLTNLRFDRRIKLGQGSNVVVRSWNSRQRAAVEQQYPGGAVYGSSNLTFVAPNLTDDTAQAKAKSLYADIAAHRATVSGEMIGDLLLMPYSRVEIVGSQGWNGCYNVDSVVRTVSAKNGFFQRFVATAV